MDRVDVLPSIIIILHATSAALSFVYGALTLLPGATHASRRNLFAYHLMTLVAMVVSLTAIIVVYWTYIQDGQRLVFLGLGVVSLYMLHRSMQARLVLCRWPHDWLHGYDDWLPSYLDHMGVTLIALFEVFVIVTALDLRTPIWLTAGIAAAGVVVGRRALSRIQGVTVVPRSGELFSRVIDALRPHFGHGFLPPIRGGAIDEHDVVAQHGAPAPPVLIDGD